MEDVHSYKSLRTKITLSFAIFITLVLIGTSSAWADKHKPWVKKADKSSVKPLKIALRNMSSLGIDFTSDKLQIKNIPNGTTIHNGKTGITIRETKIGPYIHTIKGKKIAAGLEAVVIRDLIIGAIFDGSYSDGLHEYLEPSNDNHPPPCQPCHPCPEGMDCSPPADDPPEGDCDPDTAPDGCESPTGDCDPDTAPDGCECPQALLGVSCDEGAESLLDDYNNNYF